MEGTTSELIKEISSSIKKAGASVLLLSEDVFDRIFKSNYYSESEPFRVAVEITGDRLNFIYDEFGEEVFFRELDKRILSFILGEIKLGKFKVLERIAHKD